MKGTCGCGGRFSQNGNAAQKIGHQECGQMLEMEELNPSELNGHGNVRIITTDF